MIEYVLRLATVSDAPVLAYQRRAMFEAMGLIGPADAPAVELASRRFIEREMPAGTFLSWVVERDGAVVAGGGLQLRPMMPRPGYVDDEPEVIVLSMWTEPAHRRRGLARRLVEAMLAWCRERGYRRIVLHASADGRPLYESIGFKQTNELRLDLPRDQ